MIFHLMHRALFVLFLILLPGLLLADTCGLVLDSLAENREISGRVYKISGKYLESDLKALSPMYSFYRRFLKLDGDASREIERYRDYYLGKVSKFISVKNKNVSLLRSEDKPTASVLRFLSEIGFNSLKDHAYLIHHRRKVFGVFIIPKDQNGEPRLEFFLSTRPRFIRDQVISDLSTAYE